MDKRGQILIIVALLIPIALLLLAVAIDTGRLYIERAEVRKAAQSAADAGISVLAEKMVTLAVSRQTEAASTSEATPSDTATPQATQEATPTPPLDQVALWLQDEDREQLIEEPIRSQVIDTAAKYAEFNGLSDRHPDVLALEIDYPQEGFDPYDPSFRSLRLMVSARRRATILLAGLLGRDFIELSAEAASEIAVR